MIPIILVTHGPLAPSMIESSEMLVGKSEKLSAITLQPSDNFEEFQEKIFTQAKSMDEGEGAVPGDRRIPIPRRLLNFCDNVRLNSSRF